MILTHGINSLKNITDSQLIYLTYYKDFNLSTAIDYPVIGNPFKLDYSNLTQYSIGTLTCMGK